jgi:hypothetical protein
MHVAGYKTAGHLSAAAPVTQEILDSFDASLLGVKFSSGDEDMYAEVLNGMKPDFVVDANPRVTICGQIGTKYRPRSSGRSTLVPTLLATLPEFQEDIVSEPAPLHGEDSRLEVPRDPAETALEAKYSNPVHAPPYSLLEYAINGLGEHYVSLVKDSSLMRIATESEIFNGSDTLDGWRPMMFDTSPGYDYILNRGNKTGKEYLTKVIVDEETGKKYHYFERYNPTVEQDKLYRRYLERCIAYEKGETYPTTWVAILKDEKRPVDKVKRGMTREIEMAPMDHQLAHRRYNLAFSALMINNKIKTFSGLGIDPQSLDWHDVWTHVVRVGGDRPRGFAVDYSKWDGSCGAELIMAEAKVRNIVYSTNPKTRSSENVARLMFAGAVANNYLMVRDALVYVSQGMLSGNPDTAGLNSNMQALLLYMCWAYLVPIAYRDPKYFLHYVSFITYGDDGLICVSKHVWQWYNGASVQRFLGGVLGMKVTSANKGELLDEMVDIRELTFLKRSFVTMWGGYKVARIDYSVVQGLLTWQRGKQEDLTQLMSNIDEALMEMYTYKKEVFDKMRTKIILALAKVAPGMHVPTWDHYDHRWREKYFGRNPESYGEPVDLSGIIGVAEMEYGGTRIAPVPAIEMPPVDIVPVVPGTAMPVPTIEAPPPPLEAFAKPKPWLVPDVDMDWKTLAARAQIIAVLPWNASDTALTVLKTMSVPWDFIVNATVAVPFENALAIRPRLRVIVDIQSQPMMSGKLEVIYSPMMTTTQAANIMAQPTTPYMKAHQLVELDVSEPGKQSASFTIDYWNLKQYMENYIKGPNDLCGAITIRVLNPLRSVGGSTSVTYQVSAAFDPNMEAHIPPSTPLPSARRALHLVGPNAWDKMQTEYIIGQAEAEAGPQATPVDQGVIATDHVPIDEEFVFKRFGQRKVDGLRLMLRQAVDLGYVTKSQFGPTFYGVKTTYAVASEGITLPIRPPCNSAVTTNGWVAQCGRWCTIGQAFMFWKGDMRYVFTRYDAPGDPVAWTIGTTTAHPLNKTTNGAFPDPNTMYPVRAQIKSEFPGTLAERAVFMPNSEGVGTGTRMVQQPLTQPITIVEVPGQSQYRTNINWNGYVKPSATPQTTGFNYQGDYCYSGILYVVATAVPSTTPLTGVSSMLHIKFKAGDTFRFGHPYWMPPLFIQGVLSAAAGTTYTSMYPDNYGDSTASTIKVDATKLWASQTMFPPASREERDHERRVKHLIGMAEGGGGSKSETNVNYYNTGSGSLGVGPMSLQPQTKGGDVDIKAKASVDAAALDNPSDGRQPPPMQVMAYNLASDDIVNPNYRMNRRHANQVEVDFDSFGTKEDEMSQEFWTKRMCRIATISLDATATAGKLIWCTPICPVPYMFNTKVNTAISGLPMLDWFTLVTGAKYWTGGFEFKITAAMSNQATFDLLVSPVWGVGQPPKTQISQMEQEQVRLSFNASTREHSFTVPYMGATDCLKVPHGSIVANAGERYSDYYTGVLCISVLKVLSTPGSVPATVDLNIYMRGGDGFALLQTGTINNSVTTYGAAMVTAPGMAEMYQEESFIASVMEDDKSIISLLDTIAKATSQTATNTGGSPYDEQLAELIAAVKQNSEYLIDIRAATESLTNSSAAYYRATQQSVVDTSTGIADLNTSSAYTQRILTEDIKPILSAQLDELKIIASNPQSQHVVVDNFPDIQGVGVTNWPVNQDVTVMNYVNVGNFPTNQVVTVTDHDVSLATLSSILAATDGTRIATESIDGLNKHIYLFNPPTASDNSLTGDMYQGAYYCIYSRWNAWYAETAGVNIFWPRDAMSYKDTTGVVESGPGAVTTVLGPLRQEVIEHDLDKYVLDEIVGMAEMQTSEDLERNESQASRSLGSNQPPRLRIVIGFDKPEVLLEHRHRNDARSGLTFSLMDVLKAGAGIKADLIAKPSSATVVMTNEFVTRLYNVTPSFMYSDPEIPGGNFVCTMIVRKDNWMRSASGCGRSKEIARVGACVDFLQSMEMVIPNKDVV